MVRLALFACFAAFAHGVVGVDGHVKGLFSPAGLSIRNAGSATSDGSFSTSGACGGANAFGQNGVNAVSDAQRLCARINYNGGHKTSANAFRAVFTCGAPATQTSLNALPALTLASGSSPAGSVGGTSMPSPTGNDVSGGYTLCVDLPDQGLTAATAASSSARKCTLSLLDQRNWGMCVDLQLSDAAPTSSPVSQPTASVAFDPADAGTYEITGCDEDSGGKCCLQGFLGIDEDGDVWGDLAAVAHSDFGHQTAISPDKELCATFAETVLARLQWDGDAARTFTARVLVSDSSGLASSAQDIQLLARGVRANGLVVTNEGSDSPVVSGVTATYYATLQEGVAEGVISANPSDDDGGSNVVAAAVGALVAGGVLGAAFFVLKRRQQRIHQTQWNAAGGNGRSNGRSNAQLQPAEMAPPALPPKPRWMGQAQAQSGSAPGPSGAASAASYASSGYATSGYGYGNGYEGQQQQQQQQPYGQHQADDRQWHA